MNRCIFYVLIIYFCFIQGQSPDDVLSSIEERLNEHRNEVCGDWLETHFSKSPPRSSHQLIFMHSPGGTCFGLDY
jgi:hypothetical protein